MRRGRLNELLWGVINEEEEGGEEGAADDEEFDFLDDEDAPEEEVEEPAEEEDDEEIDVPSPSEIAAQLGADVLGDAIAQAVTTASQSAISANIIGESLAREIRRIYEEEGLQANLPPLDIVVYAREIADLIRNYNTRLNIPEMIFNRAKAYVSDNYGSDWAAAFEEAISQQDIKVGIGGDERGPLAFVPIQSASDLNPTIGPISIGASGEGGGGGGGGGF